MLDKFKVLISNRHSIEILTSVTDQCLVSLSNFVTSIIAAKSLSPENFGVFAMFYTGLFVLAGFQNALITGPLRIFGISAKNTEEYYRMQNQLQILLGLVLSAILAIVLLLFGLADSKTVFYFLLCNFMFQLQELARSIDLTRLQLKVLFKNDLATHLTRMVMFLCFIKMHMFSLNMTLFIIGVSCCLGYLIRWNSNIFKTNKMALKEISAQNMKYGKWLLLETFVYTLSTQAYLYITAILIDKASAGALSAVQNLLNPINVLSLGVLSYTIPVARKKLLEAGYDEWKKWMITTGSCLMICIVLILLLIALFSVPLIRIVYSEHYVKYYSLIPILSACYLLTILNGIFSAAFRTINMPQVGFYIKAIAAVFTIVASYPLLKYLNVYGSAVGLLMTQLIWAMGSIVLIKKGYMSRKYVENYNYTS